MKLAVAQLAPIKGNIEANLQHHTNMAVLAASKQASLLIFPELSLTGYEPTLARELACEVDDPRLKVLQDVSERHSISLALGLPTPSTHGPQISMAIIKPGEERQCYAKQLLHTDELPYFTQGNQQLIFTVNQLKLAPAICYESLQRSHAAHAHKQGAQAYLASVAKAAKGMDRAYAHYKSIARQFGMMVLAANAVGPCDDFVSAGQSAIWNARGKLLAQMNSTEQGVLIVDLITEETECLAIQPSD